MSVGGLIVAFLALSLVVIVIAWPLARRDRTQAVPETRQRERLLAYYERAVRNVRDLDEDHALGKLAPADYARDRELWADRGAQVLKALDELDSAAAPLPALSETEIDAAIEQRIEAELEAARAALPREPVEAE